MTDNTQPDAGSTHIIRYALEMGLPWMDDSERDRVREALDALGTLEAQLEAICAGGVSGPLMGQPQAMPDLTALTEHGAKAWAGVDAQGLRDGFTAAIAPALTQGAAIAADGSAYAYLPPDWTAAMELLHDLLIAQAGPLVGVSFSGADASKLTSAAHLVGRIAEQSNESAKQIYAEIRASHGQAPAGAAPIVELELPEGDTRSARVGYAEMQNGVLHLCICVEDVPAAPSTPASPTIEGESNV